MTFTLTPTSTNYEAV